MSMENNILNQYKGKTVSIESSDGDVYIGKVVNAVGDWLIYTDKGEEHLMNLRYVVNITVLEEFEDEKTKRGIFGRKE